MLKMFKQLSPPVKASIWFTVCSFVQKGIQMLTVPLFTRLLTTEQYGQFSLYQSWLSLISIFATLNLSSGVFNNGMIRFPERRDAYMSSMQGLSTVTVSILFCIYIAASGQWDRLLGMPQIVVLGMFLEMLFTPALQYWMVRQRFEYRYKALVAVTLAIALMNPLLGFAAVFLSPERGVARILSVCLVNAGAGCIFYVRNMLKGRRFYVREYWRFALLFNLPLIPHYLSQMVLAQSDRIMIEKMFGKSPVAIYSIAYSIGLVMNMITGSINASFIPWTYQRCKAEQYKRIGQVSNLILLLIAGITLGLILMAPEIVSVMGPEEYADAIWIIPPVAVAGYCMLVYSLFANIEFYFEENKFVMIASTLAAVSNIALNFIGMRLFGYIAAGYTTVICYIILAVAHYCFMRRILKKHQVQEKIYNIRFILGLSLMLCLCAAVCMVLFRYWMLRYALVLLGMAIVWFKRKELLSLFQKLRSASSASPGGEKAKA